MVHNVFPLTDDENLQKSSIVTYTVIDNRHLVYVDDSNLLHFLNIEQSTQNIGKSKLIKTVNLGSYNTRQIKKLIYHEYENNGMYLIWSDDTSISWAKLDRLLLDSAVSDDLQNCSQKQLSYKWKLNDPYARIMDFQACNKSHMMLFFVVTNTGSIINFRFYKELSKRSLQILEHRVTKKPRPKNSSRNAKYVFKQDNLVSHLKKIAHDSFSELKLFSSTSTYVIATCYDNNIYCFQVCASTQKLRFIGKNDIIVKTLPLNTTNQITSTLDVLQRTGSQIFKLVVNVNNYGCVLLSLSIQDTQWNFQIIKAYKLKKLCETMAKIGVSLFCDGSKCFVLRGSERGSLYQWNTETHRGQKLYSFGKNSDSLVHSFIKSNSQNGNESIYWLQNTETIQIL